MIEQSFLAKWFAKGEPQGDPGEDTFELGGDGSICMENVPSIFLLFVSHQFIYVCAQYSDAHTQCILEVRGQCWFSPSTMCPRDQTQVIRLSLSTNLSTNPSCPGYVCYF